MFRRVLADRLRRGGQPNGASGLSWERPTMIFAKRVDGVMF